MTWTEDWVSRAPLPIMSSRDEPHPLGHEDAETEWSRPGDPSDVFLHLSSFETFTAQSQTTLFGRRGTGKTAVLRMLRDDIRQSRTSPYSHCWLIEDEIAYKAVPQLARSAFAHVDFVRDEMRAAFMEFWIWIIRVCSMKAFWYADPIKNITKYPEIYSFLYSLKFADGEGLKSSRSAYRHVADVLDEALDKKLDSRAFYSTTKELNSTEFESAWKEFEKVLTDIKPKNIVVLIDSIDIYNVKNEVSNTYVSALMKAAHNINSKPYGVSTKIAIPAELSPHVTDWHHAKSASSELYLVWTFRDLVCFLAKRVFNLVSLEQRRTRRRKFNELENYDLARSFLLQFLPERILLPSGVEEDTLVYIVRHTQKRPRQLLIVTNILFKDDPENYRTKATLISPSDVVCAVHSASQTLLKDALENYDDMYPQSIRICESVLARSRNIFSFSELQKKIESANTLLHRNGLNAKDCENLLREAGVIGQIYKCREQGSLRYCDVCFEYQVKDSIVFKQEDLSPSPRIGPPITRIPA